MVLVVLAEQVAQVVPVVLVISTNGPSNTRVLVARVVVVVAAVVVVVVAV